MKLRGPRAPTVELEDHSAIYIHMIAQPSLNNKYVSITNLIFRS